MTAFYSGLGFLQIVDTPHFMRFEIPEVETTFSLTLEDGSFCSGVVNYFEFQGQYAIVVPPTVRGRAASNSCSL